MTKKKRGLAIGDLVRERDGTAIGIVIHAMKRDPDLLVIKWPPRADGFVYHRDDLVLVHTSKGKEKP
jgi:hypothetical protein